MNILEKFNFIKKLFRKNDKKPEINKRIEYMVAQSIEQEENLAIEIVAKFWASFVTHIVRDQKHSDIWDKIETNKFLRDKVITYFTNSFAHWISPRSDDCTYVYKCESHFETYRCNPTEDLLYKHILIKKDNSRSELRKMIEFSDL